MSSEDRLRCLRLRGVPFNATEKDVREFFKGLNVTEVRFDFNSDGRPSGECYCKFDNDADVDAGMSKDRQSIGRRYIEIFRVGALEFSNYERKIENASKQPADASHGYVQVFGMPFRSGEKELVDFFKDCKVEEVVLGKEPGERGRPTGEAYVRFASKDEAAKAMLLNGQHLGQRYLELRLGDLHSFDNYKRKMTGQRPPALFDLQPQWRSSKYVYYEAPFRSGGPMYRDPMGPLPPNFGRRFAPYGPSRGPNFDDLLRFPDYHPYDYPPMRRDYDYTATDSYSSPSQAGVDRHDRYGPSPWATGGDHEFAGEYDPRDIGPCRPRDVASYRPRDNGPDVRPYGPRRDGYGLTDVYPSGVWDAPRNQKQPSRAWNVAPSSGRNSRANQPSVDPLDYKPALRDIVDDNYYDVLRNYGNGGALVDRRAAYGGRSNSSEGFPSGYGSGGYKADNYAQPYDRFIHDRQPPFNDAGSRNGYGRGESTSGGPLGLNLINFEYPLPLTKIYMRGVPFRVTAAEIEKFFVPLVCVEIKVGFYENGRSTGDGVVEFKSVADAEKALKKDHQSMGTRYIELFSPSELSRAILRTSDGAMYKIIGGKGHVSGFPW